MCGRYTLRQPGRAFKAALGKQVQDLPAARFNVSPGEYLPAVFLEDGERRLKQAFWGLVPSWTKPGERVSPIVNARSETVQTKPAFRGAFRKRRCVVPADGFYEWKTDGKLKRPYFIRFRGDEPFAFAALWEDWRNADGEVVPTFCLLTTTPNRLMEPIHDRMPVILDEERIALWLTGVEEEAEKGVPPLLTPFRADQMEASPVSSWVSKAGHEGPRCLNPWEGEEREQLSLF
jgi:putative SOS response-associated peptidase YedK